MTARNSQWRGGSRLSPTQLEVARHICNGNTADGTALALGLSVWTVKDHLKQVRYWLALNQATDLHNVIGLRRALRDAGMLEGIELL